MRVLVTWGSKRGGTEGIARNIGEALEEAGFEVDLLPADEAAKTSRFDAAIIGGALYAGRWHRAARQFVHDREKKLRSVPVWFFSSGPLDETADHQPIAPTTQVEVLMERVGAQAHVTFGGRLSPDARGFPASAMAKKHAGDWRNRERIRGWAKDIATALPNARPGVPIVHPAHSFHRLVLHGFVGWAFCAAVMGALLWTTTTPVAFALHALAAPLVFAFVARHYFHGRGARDPLPTALGFVSVVAALDLVVVAGLQHRLAMFHSVVGSWLPFASIFLVTWLIGEVMSMMPKPAERAHAHVHGQA